MMHELPAYNSKILRLAEEQHVPCRMLCTTTTMCTYVHAITVLNTLKLNNLHEQDLQVHTYTCIRLYSWQRSMVAYRPSTVV